MRKNKKRQKRRGGHSCEGRNNGGWGLQFQHHSIRQHAPQLKRDLPDSLELGRLAGKRIMQDDGICHNLHCPGKIRFDRAIHGRACHVPRAGHRGSLAEVIFAICASVVKASQPICQKIWGRDSWRQRGILPNTVKNHALPSLSFHSQALVWHNAAQQLEILLRQLWAFYLCDLFPLNFNIIF